MRDDRHATLETLQALLLLVILERLMTPKQESLEPVIAWDKVVRMARQAGHFTALTAANAQVEAPWREWVAVEASRRYVNHVPSVASDSRTISTNVLCF